MQIGGMIFDFNGVLLNDERIHCYGFQQALKEQALELTWDEYYEKYLPYDDHNFFLHFLRDRGLSASRPLIGELVNLKHQHYFKAVEQEMPLIESSVNFLRRLPPDLPLAIASGADRREIEFILNRLGLKDRFHTIVAAGDVQNGKPHPEAFLKALEGLRQREPALTAERVVVIEDSYRGVQSVRSAGMKCVALATTYPRERLKDADLVLDTLEGWTLPRLEEHL